MIGIVTVLALQASSISVADVSEIVRVVADKAAPSDAVMDGARNSERPLILNVGEISTAFRRELVPAMPAELSFIGREYQVYRPGDPCCDLVDNAIYVSVRDARRGTSPDEYIVSTSMRWIQRTVRRQSAVPIRIGQGFDVDYVVARRGGQWVVTGHVGRMRVIN